MTPRSGSPQISRGCCTAGPPAERISSPVEAETDILIVGGGLGGVAGALAALRLGRRVFLVEETDWIGVQFTADGDLVGSVTLLGEETGEPPTVHARYLLDATELGDLLELAGVERRVGAESQDETGEPHAPSGAPNPSDQQAVSWRFPLDYLPDEDHTIDMPDGYEFWRGYRASLWPSLQLAWRIARASCR